MTLPRDGARAWPAWPKRPTAGPLIAAQQRRAQCLCCEQRQRQRDGFELADGHMSSAESAKKVHYFSAILKKYFFQPLLSISVAAPRKCARARASAQACVRTPCRRCAGCSLTGAATPACTFRVALWQNVRCASAGAPSRCAALAAPRTCPRRPLRRRAGAPGCPPPPRARTRRPSHSARVQSLRRTPAAAMPARATRRRRRRRSRETRPTRRRRLAVRRLTAWRRGQSGGGQAAPPPWRRRC